MTNYTQKIGTAIRRQKKQTLPPSCLVNSLINPVRSAPPQEPNASSNDVSLEEKEEIIVQAYLSMVAQSKDKSISLEEFVEAKKLLQDFIEKQPDKSKNTHLKKFSKMVTDFFKHKYKDMPSSVSDRNSSSKSEDIEDILENYFIFATETGRKSIPSRELKKIETALEEFIGQNPDEVKSLNFGGFLNIMMHLFVSDCQQINYKSKIVIPKHVHTPFNIYK